MSEQKKPEAGEFWSDGAGVVREIVYVSGADLCAKSDTGSLAVWHVKSVVDYWKPVAELCAACDSPAEPGTAGCEDHNTEAVACLSPFGDAMSPPENRVSVRLEWLYPTGPMKVTCEDGSPSPSGNVRSDANGFFIERQS